MHKFKIIGNALFIVLLVLIIVYLLLPSKEGIENFPIADDAYEAVPDFARYEQVVDKKQAFFNYLAPAIRAQNEHVLNIRDMLIAYKAKEIAGESLTKRQNKALTWLIQEYRVSDDLSRDLMYEQLLLKVDIIPIELVLVQAANESAWGTSRFARNGYNFFGIWCFKKGCGFVPNKRNEAASHEVAKYESLSHAVYAYMLNLNRHEAYKELREIRKQRRQQQQEISAVALIEGLSQYSERGEAYIEELQHMIRTNKGLMPL